MASSEKQAQVAAQNEIEPEVQHESQSKSKACGHPPQKPGAKFPINTGVPNIGFYTPNTQPPSGQILHEEGSIPKLFQPLTIRGLTFKNRIWVSPMCQYSCETGTGKASDWHLVHQGQFSVRGSALIITEAAGVLQNGRISPEDLGIWNDDQIAPLKRITDFHHSQGALAGIQLAHAGRKASTYAPWLMDGLISPPPVKVEMSTAPPEAGGWTDTWAPSAVPFDEKHITPQEMTIDQVDQLKQAFLAAAKRSLQAGYDVIELHGAHGYLLHSFVSPVSNLRTDKYGGSFENRVKLPLEIAKEVRAILPDSMPLFYRVSATDWHEKGEKNEQGEYISWGSEQNLKFAKLLKEAGVDLIDVSSGGNYSKQKIDIGPSYQVPYAAELKADKDLKDFPISSVGLITEPKQAEEILQKGQSDVIFLAREFLRNADFVTRAAYEFDCPISVPVQYQRAHTRLYKSLHNK